MQQRLSHGTRSPTCLGVRLWFIKFRCQVDLEGNLLEMYSALGFHDHWLEGGIVEAVRYVRGSKRLRMPAKWRPVFPKELPPDSGSEID